MHNAFSLHPEPAFRLSEQQFFAGRVTLFSLLSMSRRPGSFSANKTDRGHDDARLMEEVLFAQQHDRVSLEMWPFVGSPQLDFGQLRARNRDAMQQQLLNSFITWHPDRIV